MTETNTVPVKMESEANIATQPQTVHCSTDNALDISTSIPDSQELPAVSLKPNDAELRRQHLEYKQKLEEIEQQLGQQADESAQKSAMQAENSVIQRLDLSEKGWKALYEAVVGLKHRKPMPPQPCQDAALAVGASADAPFSVVITSDGAGSREVSDIGSQRIVTGIYRLIHTLYRSQFESLDREEEVAPETAQRWALILTKHAKGILEDLGREYRRPARDFCCTLLVGLVGKCQTFWFKIGDGMLVKEVCYLDAEGQPIYKLSSLGEVGKGEFANETVFISEELTPEKVQYGTFICRDLSGLFSMSDGSALKLVSNDGQRVAATLSHLTKELRAGKLQRLNLTKLFYSDSFLEGHDGDDCSIAFIAR